MTVEYKPGRTNVIADALSRRPSEEAPSCLSTLSEVRSDLFDRIRGSYSLDPALSRTIDAIIAGKSLSTKVVQIGRFTFHDNLLWYTVTPEDAPRVAVPCDTTLRAEIIREFHDTPSGGHFGRDKTYLSVARSFGGLACTRRWHVSSHRVSLDIPLELWESVSMDFIFGLPSDKSGNTGIFTLVDRASKYLIALPVKASITAEQSARLFFDNVYCHFGLSSSIVSDRDPRFTSHFWRALFALCGTTLNMSSSDHPESDGQTECANRVLEDILRSYALSRPKTWSSMLPTACFAYNTSVHASTGFTPFYAVHLKHPRLPSDVDRPVSSVGGFSDDIPRRTAASVEHFASSRESVILRLRENIASAQAKQAREANKHNRGNTNVYSVNDLVYLHRSAVKGSSGSSKLRSPWLGPFSIRKVISPVNDEFELPDDWDIHPVIYTGKLKRHIPQEDVTSSTPRTECSPAGSSREEHEDARPRGLSPPRDLQQDARVPSTSSVGGRRAFFTKFLHLNKARLQIATLRTLDMELLLKALKTTFKLLLGVVIPAAQFRNFITQATQIVIHRASLASRTLLRLSARTFRFRLSRA
ncbi:hypothetical protein AeNC1_016484 [Aphanomyces euteiches]|nr:hypothetical protein AeNC1_016484 [Aphanomyces euteiches]